MAYTVEFLEHVEDLTLDLESANSFADLTALGFAVTPASGKTPPKLTLSKDAKVKNRLLCRKEVHESGNTKHVFLLDTGLEVIEFFTQYQLKSDFSYTGVDKEAFKKAVETRKRANEIAKNGNIKIKDSNELANVLMRFQQTVVRAQSNFTPAMKANPEIVLAGSASAELAKNTLEAARGQLIQEPKAEKKREEPKAALVLAGVKIGHLEKKEEDEVLVLDAEECKQVGLDPTLTFAACWESIGKPLLPESKETQTSHATRRFGAIDGLDSGAEEKRPKAEKSYSLYDSADIMSTFARSWSKKTSKRMQYFPDADGGVRYCCDQSLSLVEQMQEQQAFLRDLAAQLGIETHKYAANWFDFVNELPPEDLSESELQARFQAQMDCGLYNYLIAGSYYDCLAEGRLEFNHPRNSLKGWGQVRSVPMIFEDAHRLLKEVLPFLCLPFTYLADQNSYVPVAKEKAILSAFMQRGIIDVCPSRDTPGLYRVVINTKELDFFHNEEIEINARDLCKEQFPSELEEKFKQAKESFAKAGEKSIVAKGAYQEREAENEKAVALRLYETVLDELIAQIPDAQAGEALATKRKQLKIAKQPRSITYLAATHVEQAKAKHVAPYTKVSVRGCLPSESKKPTLLIADSTDFTTPMPTVRYIDILIDASFSTLPEAPDNPERIDKMSIIKDSAITLLKKYRGQKGVFFSVSVYSTHFKVNGRTAAEDVVVWGERPIEGTETTLIDLLIKNIKSITPQPGAGTPLFSALLNNMEKQRNFPPPPGFARERSVIVLGDGEDSGLLPVHPSIYQILQAQGESDIAITFLKEWHKLLGKGKHTLATEIDKEGNAKFTHESLTKIKKYQEEFFNKKKDRLTYDAETKTYKAGLLQFTKYGEPLIRGQDLLDLMKKVSTKLATTNPDGSAVNSDFFRDCRYFAIGMGSAFKTPQQTDEKVAAERQQSESLARQTFHLISQIGDSPDKPKLQQLFYLPQGGEIARITQLMLSLLALPVDHFVSEDTVSLFLLDEASDISKTISVNGEELYEAKGDSGVDLSSSAGIKAIDLGDPTRKRKLYGILRDHIEKLVRSGEILGEVKGDSVSAEGAQIGIIRGKFIYSLKEPAKLIGVFDQGIARAAKDLFLHKRIQVGDRVHWDLIRISPLVYLTEQTASVTDQTSWTLAELINKFSLLLRPELILEHIFGKPRKDIILELNNKNIYVENSTSEQANRELPAGEQDAEIMRLRTQVQERAAALINEYNKVLQELDKHPGDRQEITRHINRARQICESIKKHIDGQEKKKKDLPQLQAQLSAIEEKESGSLAIARNRESETTTQLAKQKSELAVAGKQKLERLKAVNSLEEKLRSKTEAHEVKVAAVRASLLNDVKYQALNQPLKPTLSDTKTPTALLLEVGEALAVAKSVPDELVDAYLELNALKVSALLALLNIAKDISDESKKWPIILAIVNILLQFCIAKIVGNTAIDKIYPNHKSSIEDTCKSFLETFNNGVAESVVRADSTLLGFFHAARASANTVGIAINSAAPRKKDGPGSSRYRFAKEKKSSSSQLLTVLASWLKSPVKECAGNIPVPVGYEAPALASLLAPWPWLKELSKHSQLEQLEEVKALQIALQREDKAAALSEEKFKAADAIDLARWSRDEEKFVTTFANQYQVIAKLEQKEKDYKRQWHEEANREREQEKARVKLAREIANNGEVQAEEKAIKTLETKLEIERAQLQNNEQKVDRLKTEIATLENAKIQYVEEIGKLERDRRRLQVDIIELEKPFDEIDFDESCVSEGEKLLAQYGQQDLMKFVPRMMHNEPDSNGLSEAKRVVPLPVLAVSKSLSNLLQEVNAAEGRLPPVVSVLSQPEGDNLTEEMARTVAVPQCNY